MYKFDSVHSMLERYEKSGPCVDRYYKQTFTLPEGFRGCDVYNPAYPMMIHGQSILPVRVERRNSETDSRVMFFRNVDAGTWAFNNSLRGVYQDPCWINFPGKNGDWVCADWEAGKLWIGAVDPTKEKTVTRFFVSRGYGIMEPMAVIEGKDVRCCYLSGRHSRIARFTREDVTTIHLLIRKHHSDADLSGGIHKKFKFYAGEWGGVNHVQELTSYPRQLGVLGHIAYINDDGKHYYPIAFVIDAHTGKIVKAPKILCTRDDLPIGPAKRPELKDVLFPGGIVLHGDTANLWLGVSDCETYKVVIKNPFI